MTMPDYAPNEVPRGYLSTESKRKFTITAGILGAVFFGAQFILPFVVMLIAMPLMVFGEVFTRFDARGAVLWDDAIWLTEEGASGAVLKRIDLREGKAPETVCELSSRESKLLADANGLWIISSAEVTRYDHHGLGEAVAVRRLGNCCRPFFAFGRPATVEDRPDGTYLLIYDEGQWQRRHEFDLGERFEDADIGEDLQVLSQGPMLHVFLRHRGTLYHRTSLIAVGPEELPSAWRAVGPARESWQAALTDQAVFAFCQQGLGPTWEIVGYQTTGPAWERFFADKAAIVSGFGVCPLPGDTRFILLGQSFPGSLRVLRTEGAHVASRETLGKTSFLPKGFRLALMVPHMFTFLLPLILAMVLSGMMRRHRAPTYQTESAGLPYASLTRRALAQLVDGLILAGPCLVGYVLMMDMFTSPDTLFESGPMGMLGMPLLMCGGLLWVILSLLIFSVTEGSSGGTPGKWLLRIRVLGLDLQPCGFGRAFVRNILKFVDGFFNFLVGVMVAALSENWQRVGDMAARTIVVDVRTGVQQPNVL